MAQRCSNPYRNSSRSVNNNAIPILALPLQHMYTYGSAKNFTANADSPILLSHLHACRYTHTHTHTPFLSHICMLAGTHTHTPHPLTFACLQVHTHPQSFSHIWVHTHTHTMRIYMHVHMHTQCTHTQTHTYTHAHVPTEIFVPRKEVCQRWFVTDKQIGSLI